MIGWPYIRYFIDTGMLRHGTDRVLDIGTQNLLALSAADVRFFVERFGANDDRADIGKEADRLSYFSTPRPGERTTYVSELLALTNLTYESVDIAPGLKTTIFDLNEQEVPEAWRGSFDMVWNFGTSEHVLNQWNCFKLMHDATKVGGHIFHQVPASGWVEHGYFAYRAQFFHDLAAANDYEIADIWFNEAGIGRLDIPRIDWRKGDQPAARGSGIGQPISIDVINFNINVAFRKRSAAAFRAGLETATSHAAIDEGVARKYRAAAAGATSTPAAARVNDTLRDLAGPLRQYVRRAVTALRGSEASVADHAVGPMTTEIYRPPEAPFPKLAGEAGRLCLAGMVAETEGRRDQAFRFHAQATQILHGYPPAIARMKELATFHAREAEEALANRADATRAISALVKIVEMDRENGAARARLDSLLSEDRRIDYTKHCFVAPDRARAEAIHREAIRRVLDFVSFAGVAGEVLEFGVLAGWSARIFAETMRDQSIFADLHLFDSFDGLPEYVSAVDQKSYEIAGRDVWPDRMRFSADFVAALGETIDEHVARNLATIIRRERIHVHRGFYVETLRQPPPIKAAVVHVDCDLYQSTVEVLTALHRHDMLVDGCVIMFDDWNCNRANPNYGERRAFREFLEGQSRFVSTPFFTYGFNGAVFFLHDTTA